jgi:hypothetical protein
MHTPALSNPGTTIATATSVTTSSLSDKPDDKSDCGSSYDVVSIPSGGSESGGEMSESDGTSEAPGSGRTTDCKTANDCDNGNRIANKRTLDEVSGVDVSIVWKWEEADRMARWLIVAQEGCKVV